MAGCKPTMETDQPTITDFTAVVGRSPSPRGPVEFHLRVKLDSRWVTVGEHKTRDKAEIAELAISQMAIEYRTKRNAWEKSLVK